jgi:hypothetical protein
MAGYIAACAQIRAHITPLEKNMCWLCSYQGEMLGKQLNDFIVTNIGFMDLNCISQQVSDFLLLKHPEAEDAEKHHVFTHIHTHMLNPKVRIAVMLRQLLELAGLLQNNIVVHDGESSTIEKSNAELYLKIISQIMTLYKMDPNGMIFAEDITTAAMSTTVAIVRSG